MFRWILAVLCLILVLAPAQAAGITGQYVEARTCEVFTGPCFANGESGLAGKHAVLAWKVDQGTLNDVSLDGLGIVAIVAADETLGLRQTTTPRSMLIVDSRATPAQRDALIALAKGQAGPLLANVIRVESAAVSLTTCECSEGACAKLEAGPARIQTRCINKDHDKGCGNEWAYYPPLSKTVKAQAAVAVEHSVTGTAFNETWKDNEKRGAYVGAFEVK